MNHVTYKVGADMASYDASVARSIQRHIQPLGRITGKASEFQKSLEASHARVLAFGASAGAIYTLKRAFDFTVGSMIDVEKALVDINTLLGLNVQDLAKFGSELFAVAVKTSSSFKDASSAAAEFSRQGLSVNETLNRTEVALGITRLSGLELTESISSLTAAMNTFNKEGLTAIQFGDKLATVDARFAVSAGDLAQAIKRVGSTAEDANVSLDQMLAVVTATQQKTARGGAIIGNAFKTIFTRLQRPQVISQLEQLGIKTREITGEVLPLMTILSDLAQKYDNLAPSVRAQTSELIGGVFQVNVLKAALSDLGSGFSNYDAALKVAGKSTGEFKRRNDELNQTLSAKLAQTLAISTNLFSKLGEITLKPIVSGGIGAVKNLVTSLDDLLTVDKTYDPASGKVIKEAQGMGGEAGHFLATSFLGALSGILAGPGMQVVATILTKLSMDFLKFFRGSIGELAGVTTGASRFRDTLKEISEHLRTNPEFLKRISDGTMSIADLNKAILNHNIANNQQLLLTESISRRIASIQTGYSPQPSIISTSIVGAGKLNRKGKIFAGGFNPDFLSEEATARGLGASRNVSAHYSEGTIGGRQFVMNNEEFEIVGAGKNGDSAVIPTYGNGPSPVMKGHSLGFIPAQLAEGFSPTGGDASGGGVNILNSIVLGMLSTLGDTGEQMIDKFSGISEALSGAKRDVEEASETMARSKRIYDRQAEYKGGEIKKAEQEIFTIQNKAKKDKKAESIPIIEASDKRLATLNEAKTLNLKGVEGKAAKDIALQEAIEKTSAMKMDSAKLEMDKIQAGVKSSEQAIDEQTNLKVQAIRDSGAKEKAGFVKTQRIKNEEIDNSIAQAQQNADNAKRRIDSIKKRGGNSYVKNTPEEKRVISGIESYISGQLSKVSTLEGKKVKLDKVTKKNIAQSESKTANEMRLAGLSGDKQKEQVREEASPKLKAGQSQWVAAEKDFAFALDEKARLVNKLDVDKGDINRTHSIGLSKEFKVRDDALEASASKIDKTAADKVKAQNDYLVALKKSAEEAKKRAEQEQKDTAYQEKMAEERKAAIEAEMKERRAAEKATRGKAMWASVGLSSVAGTGQVGKTVGSMAGEGYGQAAQGMVEGAATGAQIIMAMPTIYGKAAAAIYVLGNSARLLAHASTGEATKLAVLGAALEQTTAEVSRSNSAINEYTQLLSPLKSAYYDNSISTQKLTEMQFKASRALAQLAPETRIKLSAATTDKEKSQILFDEQASNAKKQKEAEGEVAMQKRIVGVSDKSMDTRMVTSGLSLGIIPLIQEITDAIGGKGATSTAIKNMTSGPSLFDSTGVFMPRSKAEEKRDNADLAAYTSYTVSSADEKTTDRAYKALSNPASSKMSSEDQLRTLVNSGMVKEDVANNLKGEQLKMVVDQIKFQIFETKALEQATKKVSEARKSDVQDLHNINTALEIIDLKQKSVLSSMNSSINNFVSGILNASENLTKLANAKNSNEMIGVKANVEIAGMRYGAQTMNRIGGQQKQAEILTSLGNEKATNRRTIANSAADNIMKGVLSKTDTILKNPDGSQSIPEEALQAKDFVKELIQGQIKDGVTDPEKMVAGIRTGMAKMKPLTSVGDGKKLIDGVKVAEGVTVEDKTKTAAFKSQVEVGLLSGTEQALKDMNSTLLGMDANSETNAKIALDEAKAGVAAQERLIAAQRDARLFGNLPATKQEAKLVEKQFKTESRKSNKGDVYASNRLLSLLNQNFGDSLEESSVAGLKGKVKAGEFKRITGLTKTIESGGAVRGFSRQFNPTRLMDIAAAKTNAGLKTEDKNLDPKKLIEQGMSKPLVDSNNALLLGLNNLEKTLRDRISTTVPMAPDLAKNQAEEKARNAQREAERKKQSDIMESRAADIEKAKNEIFENMKRGIKTVVEGGVSVTLAGTEGMSEEIVEGMRDALQAMIKAQVKETMDLAAGGPAHA